MCAKNRRHFYMSHVIISSFDDMIHYVNEHFACDILKYHHANLIYNNISYILCQWFFYIMWKKYYKYNMLCFIFYFILHNCWWCICMTLCIHMMMHLKYVIMHMLMMHLKYSNIENDYFFKKGTCRIKWGIFGLKIRLTPKHLRLTPNPTSFTFKL